MSFLSYLALFAIAAVAFLVIDLFWLGVVAKQLYAHYMGDLIADKPNKLAAALFYVMFLIGLIYFAIQPAVHGGTMRDAMVKGALYGLFTYGTYDLTNWAVLRGYPGGIAVIDMIWGTVLSFAVATSTYLVYDKFN